MTVFRCIALMSVLVLNIPFVSGEPSTSTPGWMAVYRQESAVEPRQFVRMLGVPGFLRIDDGGQTPGFVLFDQAAQTIYSVASEERNILVIPAKPLPGTPAVKLELEQDYQTDADAPKVAGHTPLRYLLQVNGEDCVHAVVVPGLLEPLRELLRAYRQLLAGEQAAALAMIPAELQSPCDLAHNVYAADHYLAKGWPLFLREPDGRFSELVDFDAAFVADKALFNLPAGYTRSVVGGVPE